MTEPLILASGSDARRTLLAQAGVAFTVRPACVDEPALREGLTAEGVAPRDIADALGEAKARRVAAKAPEARVIGCDQVLALDGAILGKPADTAGARQQLGCLRGRRHTLYAAAVAYQAGAPVWRHVGVAHLTMRAVSDAGLDAYVARHGAELCQSAGAYRVEGDGVRLFARIEGDYFTVLGLPLLELLTHLVESGHLPA